MRKFKYTVPIHHYDPESRYYEEKGAYFVLMSTGKMGRQSFIDLDHVYSIPIDCMRTFSYKLPHDYCTRIDVGSYHGLMEALNLQPEPYLNIHELKSAAEKRLRNLAETEVRRWENPEAEESEHISEGTWMSNI